MSYTVAALLGVVGALVLDLALLRTRLVTQPTFWLTYPIVLFFQLISNGILTGRGVVRYAPDAIIGWRLAYAPVEDLAFGFALVLATLALWTRLGRAAVTAKTPGRTHGRRGQRTPGTDHRRPAAGAHPAPAPASRPHRGRQP